MAPSQAELDALNQGLTLPDELRREDEVAKLVVTVGVAGSIAASSVAAAANVGIYSTAFVLGAVICALAAAIGMISLALAALRANTTERTPWEALLLKRRINRAGLSMLLLGVLTGLLMATLLSLAS